MSATLLHRADVTGDTVSTPSGDIDLDEYGDWKDDQDPLTGEIVKVWEPYQQEPTFHDFTVPGSTGKNTVSIRRDIPCVARGIVDGGIRVAGTTERFGDAYENVDFVKLWLPPKIVITKRDRITNIRDRSGRVRWLDEEYYDPENPADTLRATVFNVNGVTPLFDAFNNLVEWFALLERVDDI